MRKMATNQKTNRDIRKTGKRNANPSFFQNKRASPTSELKQNKKTSFARHCEIENEKLPNSTPKMCYKKARFQNTPYPSERLAEERKQ